MLRRFFQISAERMGAYSNEGALKQLENDLVVVGEFMALTKSEGKRTKFKRRDNTHKGTLQAHGYRNNCK